MRHKPFPVSDSRSRAFGGDFGAGTGFIIGYGLEIVAPRQERPGLAINTRIIFSQPQKFRLDAAMGFEHSAVALEDGRLRGMEPGKIGGAPGRVDLGRHRA